MGEKYDFSGWATKNDVRCSDGRIIRRNAFKDCDGRTVPLVWNHQHGGPENVVGKALLHNMDQGVYVYGSLNNTEKGLAARECLKHGDVLSLSIYANQLKQKGGDVFHGMIREVSLVLAGANPEALIDNIMIHGDKSDDEAVFYWGESDDIRLYHGGDAVEDDEDEDDEEPQAEEDENDEEEKDMAHSSRSVADIYHGMSEEQKYAVQAIVNQAIADKEESTMQHSATTSAEDIFASMSGKQKDCVMALVGMALAKVSPDAVRHGDFSDDCLIHSEDGAESIGAVWKTLNEDQKKVAYALVQTALDAANADTDDEEDGEDDEEMDNESEGGSTMKHNLFDDETMEMNEDCARLSHSEMQELSASIFADAQQCGSLREAVLAHGIEDIDFLFPDAQTLDNTPRTINQRTGWVPKVMDNVKHSPISRVKSLFVDIREDDARAKGYMKGNRKYEEVVIALKRVTTPTTIYKKQAIDRDDYVDITDFDVVAFLKNEMRGKLDEEIARAILIGDGRSVTSQDKINEQNIRPIWTDDDLFTVKKTINVASNATADQKARAWIKEAVKARKEYRGTGNPVMFCSEDMLADALLIEDTLGRRIYDTEAQLCAAMRVKEIVAVPDFENKSRIVNGTTHFLAGIMVNLNDYNVGTDRHGAINMFDDFDIDYNQMKYLMEGRMSGAMTVPYGAVALEMVYSLMLDIDAIAPGTTILGKNTSDLQSDIVVNDSSISGTLKYVTGYTGYSGDPAEQSGNFLALEYDTTAGSTTTIELIGGTTGVVTLDADKQSVTRVTNKNTQKLRVITTKGGETVTRVLSLRTLTCLNA